MLNATKVIILRIDGNDESGKEYSHIRIVMGIGALQGVVGGRTKKLHWKKKTVDEKGRDRAVVKK